MCTKYTLLAFVQRKFISSRLPFNFILYTGYWFMRKYFLLLLLLWINAVAYAQPKPGDAFLQLNTGGHLSQISEGIATPDGKYIITTSTDKTVCIWDAQRAVLVDQIRGAKSVFNQGKLYALAISPDSRFLAVGGFLAIGTEADGALAGRIRVYDFPSRKQIALLSGHGNVVTALRFSADGKYLLSGAADSSLITWEILAGVKPSFQMKKKVLRNDLFAEDMQVFGRSVIVSERQQVVKYTVSSLAKTAVSETYGVVAGINIDNRSNTVAIVSDSIIVILDTALVERQVIQLDDKSARVAISPGGEFLVSEGNEGRLQIFQRKGGVFRHYTYADFSAGATLLALGFMNGTEFFAGGGTLNVLHLYTLRNGKAEKRAELGGAGRPFPGIAADENGFLLDQDLRRQHIDSFNRYFDLRAGVLTVAGDRRPTTLANVYEKDSLRIELDPATGSLLIFTHEEQTGKIDRDGTNGYMHRAVTITKNNLIVSASAAGFLNVYDNRGRMLAALVGHEGDLFHIAESADGKFLYSTSMDQTIRTWDLREITGKPGFKSWEELGREWQDFLNTYYPGIDYTIASAISDVYKLMIGAGDPNAEFLVRPQQVSSRMNLFISRSGEWVMWNNAGYFKSSANGANYIGWYVYKGEEENAEFYTADKLFDNYYRPDIVNELLTTHKPAEEVLAEAAVGRKSVAQQVSQMPVLRLARPGNQLTVDQKNIDLVFQVTGSEYIDEVVLYQNGKRVLLDSLNASRSSRQQLVIPVDLVKGENEFKVTVFNKSRVESEPVHVAVKYTGVQPAGSLYILAIGVDQYRNSRYNLNYAKADARGMAIELSKAARSLYKQIYIDSLFDKEATTENLQQKLGSLREKVQPEDVFIFFYAGHGVMSDPEDAKEADFYLVLHNVTQMLGNEQQLASNGFSSTSLKRSLLEIRAQKQLIFFDACNAGGAVNNFTRGAGEEAAILQLARSTGMTVLSSTNQEQQATEVGQLGHGIFTYALLNGINGEADLKKDGKVTVKEIELYLNEVIPLLSEKYKGTQQFPQSFSRGMDFPLTFKAN